MTSWQEDYQTPQDCAVEEEELSSSTSVSCSESSDVKPTEAELAKRECRLCKICGDKALGYNFNTLSCESCKAFFRRNAFKNVFGRCSGSCEITVATRSYCKRCRLKKCFDMGMNRNLILTDRQKSLRKKRNCGKQIAASSTVTEVVGSSDEAVCSASSSDKTSAVTAPAAVVATTAPVSSPTPSSSKYLAGEKQSGFGSAESPAKDIHEGGFIDVIEHLFEIPETMRPNIRHLAQAFYNALETESPKPMKEVPSPTEFINMADQWVRRLVKLNKKLEDFRQLGTGDQIALLKGCMVELLVLLSATSFDREKKGWSVADHNSGTCHKIASDNLNMGKSGMGLYADFLENYFTFIVKFMDLLQGDRILLMLVVMISVFSADRPNVEASEAISDIQIKYTMMLYDYIHFRYPRKQNLFAKLMMKLTDIRDMNESHTKALANMEFDQLEPLCAEIYDL